MNTRTGALLAGSAVVAAAASRRRRSAIDLHGRVVFVTGGSRGLGLALARRFHEEGAAVALCARNGDQAKRAAAELHGDGPAAVGYACDVSDREQVDATVRQIVDRFGHLDALVTNAGTIQVGPFAAQTEQDYADALATMFWGVYHPTMAALPYLRERDGARVAVISSIGGKIAVPHLLPYSVAKFAAAGFSEGLRSELAREGIKVTTVVPGLMGTGSHVNAVMKGDHAAEYRWFSLGATLPLTATTAEHAARRIVAATRRGDAEVILTWQAQLAVRAHGLAPGLTTRALALVGRMLPAAPKTRRAEEPVLGADTGGELRIVHDLGDDAVQRLHENDPSP